MLAPGAPEFSAWFTQFRRSCFRLETLQHYGASGEDDSIRVFAAGGDPAPHRGKRDWMKLVDAAVRDGRVVQRVHVVREPVTPYVMFEVAWSYAYSVAAGEDVRIIATGDSWPVGLPHRDFWLFDDVELFDMCYSEDGTWLGVEHANADAALWACDVRDRVLQLSVPWQDYIAVRPELALRVPVVQWHN